MSPLLRKNDIIRLYPNWLIYLFLAVFAFSSPFCYAKTAFSYSRALLSPCTPVLFMVKDVVKSKYRMIVMWSCFRVVEALKICSADREEIHREQRRNTPTGICGQERKMRWFSCGQRIQVARSRGRLIPLLPMLYCNSYSSGCQGPLKIKVSTQNLICSKQRKKFFKWCWQNCICMV